MQIFFTDIFSIRRHLAEDNGSGAFLGSPATIKGLLAHGPLQFVFGNSGYFEKVFKETDLQGCVAVNGCGNACRIAGFSVDVKTAGHSL
jgi:hypothetical protein